MAEWGKYWSSTFYKDSLSGEAAAKTTTRKSLLAGPAWGMPPAVQIKSPHFKPEHLVDGSAVAFTSGFSPPTKVASSSSFGIKSGP